MPYATKFIGLRDHVGKGLVMLMERKRQEHNAGLVVTNARS